MCASEYVFGPTETFDDTTTLPRLSVTADEVVLAEQVVPPATTVEAETFDDAQQLTWMELVDLILKSPERLTRLLRVDGAAVVLLPRLLAICLAGFVLFGAAAAMVLTISGVWPRLTAIADWLNQPMSTLVRFVPNTSAWGMLEPWLSGDALALIGAYAFGLVAATGVALPSLYFYCLLSGVRMTMLDVVVHAIRSKAMAAVALVGIVPVYVAIAMGAVIFGVRGEVLQFVLYLGLILPMIAGLWGVATLYRGFPIYCDTMPADRARRRACFLRRLVLAWSACYTAVMPVMIFTLWEVFSRS